MCCFCPDCTGDILGPAARRPSRRTLVASAAAAALAGFTAAPARAQPAEFRRQVMRLNIANRSTGERFEGVFWHHGSYD